MAEKFSEVNQNLESPLLNHTGFELLTRLLSYDPKSRITAKNALNHSWFREEPGACQPSEIRQFECLNKVSRKERLQDKLDEDYKRKAEQDKNLIELTSFVEGNVGSGGVGGILTTTTNSHNGNSTSIGISQITGSSISNGNRGYTNGIS